jgi:hypothetical protein
VAGVQRRRLALEGGGEVLADIFHDHSGAACCFIRLARGGGRTARLIFDGVDEVIECAAGG